MNEKNDNKPNKSEVSTHETTLDISLGTTVFNFQKKIDPLKANNCFVVVVAILF